MTDAELLVECKIGLGIPVDQTGFDGVLTQKLRAVKAYMSAAGVSEAMMTDDLAVGAVVLGVTDLWNIQGGGVQFSPVFVMAVSQLTISSLPTA